MALSPNIKDRERDKFGETTTDSKTAVRIIAPDGIPVSVGAVDITPADDGTTTLATITTVEVEVTAATGQKDITITNLSAGNLYYSFETGVSSSNHFMKKREQLVANNFASSIFLIRSSGSSDIQIDREIKT